MKVLLLNLGTIPFFLCVYNLANAQTHESEPAISVKITRIINGQEQVFEGSYETEEQMQMDPNYQAFIDPKRDSVFRSDSPSFPYFLKKMDSVMKSRTTGTEGLEDHLRMMEAFVQRNAGQVDEFFNQAFSDSMRALNNFPFDFSYQNEGHAMPNGKVRFETVEEGEFGKRSKLKPDEMLELPDLAFRVNGWDKTFNLSFKVPDQGELSVNIFDVAGQEIFSQHFDQFGGYFSELVDLNNQRPGEFLLEIKVDKNRLLRKLVLE